MRVQVGVLRLPRETLQALLSKALARDWTPAQAGILAQVDGVETVKQAVRRISQTGPGLPVSSPHVLLSMRMSHNDLDSGLRVSKEVGSVHHANVCKHTLSIDACASARWA